MTSLHRKVLTPSLNIDCQALLPNCFLPESLGHDAHHLSLCIRETLLVSFRIGGYLALRLN